MRVGEFVSRLGVIGSLGLPLALATPLASAQTKLEAHYRATLAGMPVGTGAWIIDLADDQYAMAASGQVTGILRVFSNGSGTAAVKGAIQGHKLIPANYALNIKARRSDEVRIALAGGVVKSLVVEPPPKPNSERVPLTDAHKRGVIDPMSAGVLPRAGDSLSPEVCKRTVAIFDGRHRYDLSLSFKRMDKVKAERGYEGPIVVCGVRYHPISGHENERFAIRYLREATEIEVAYAPIAGTRFVAMYRVHVPTTMGPAILEATRFVVGSRGVRAAGPKT